MHFSPEKEFLNPETLRAFRCWKSRLLSNHRCVTVNELLDNLLIINSDNIQAAYLVFYNRMHHFTRFMLEEGLYKNNSIGRVRGLRKNLNLVPQDQLELLFTSTQSQREFRIKSAKETWGVTDSEFTEIARYILNELESGEKKKSALMKKLPKGLKRTIETEIGKNKVSNSNVDLILDWLLDRWQIIPGIESWGRTGRRFCLYNTFHKRARFSNDYKSGESKLVHEYIRRYGPVTFEDIGWWCDLTANRCRQILEILPQEISTFETHEPDKLWYIHKTDLDELSRFREPLHDLVHLLSENDPLLTGYRDNDTIVNEKFEDDIYPSFGNAAPTVLINGEASGTWKFIESATRTKLSVEMFRYIGSKAEDKLLLEIDRLGDFLGGENKLTEVNLTYR